ncbi:glycosyltransferase [Rhodothermus marinus]|uniref:glycosyltransferase n=1 Tax=Rhodothermus marinus TaxID=29549 RepID=UPI0037CC22DE
MPHNEARPLLSLCMIVKNEAEYLETCLKLARPHVDEIVIIDTGSTDGTQDIARRYADVFEEIEWPNSFAAARNYSLDRASGQYILILDGDEYIADSRDWILLRQIIQEVKPVAARLRVRNVLPSSELIAADVLWQERVFINHPVIRYRGKVHNQVIEGIAEYIINNRGSVVNINVEILHVGYAFSYDKLIQKYMPRIALLKEEIKNADNEVYREYYKFQLGIAYYIIGDLENSANVFKSINYSTLCQANPENAFYASLIASQVFIKIRNPVEAMIHCDRMLTISRKEPVAYFVTGMAMILNKEIENGLLMLLESIEMTAKDNENVRFPVNFHILKESIINTFEALKLNSCVESMKRNLGNDLEGFVDWIADMKKMIILHAEKKAGASI